MATHSSILAWRIPGTGEPGHLESPSKWSMFSALGKTEDGAEDFCWDMAL